MFKQICIMLAITLSISTGLFAAEKKPVPVKTAKSLTKIMEIKLGNVFPNKIQVLKFQDPDMPFITIYLSNIKAGNPTAFADPSDNSIATRLTGKVGTIVKTMNPSVIDLKKSIGWKSLKLARVWDEANKSVVYVTYSTKWMDGSLKHSLSAVALGNLK